MKRRLKSTYIVVIPIYTIYLYTAKYSESNIMKYYFLTIACIALFFCSCQKEDQEQRLYNSPGSNGAGASASQRSLSQTKLVQYGALIDAPGIIGSLDFQVKVADQLNISCLRSRVKVPGRGNVPILNTVYKVLLNFNSNRLGATSPFVTNLAKYETDLRDIVSGFTMMPVVAVIENEESNAGYYNGTAREYINQLNKAIAVMHSYGIKVANGGITSTGLNYLVYQDFLNQGKKDSAEQFKSLAHVLPNSLQTQERGAFISTLLQAYAQMDLDYVNFHWKGESTDTRAFTEVINYLKKVTRKKIISNELGQVDKNPNTLTTYIQKCKEESFPYIVWYSPNESQNEKATPLQHSDASLTTTGIAYQNYPKN